MWALIYYLHILFCSETRVLVHSRRVNKIEMSVKLQLVALLGTTAIVIAIATLLGFVVFAVGVFFFFFVFFFLLFHRLFDFVVLSQQFVLADVLQSGGDVFWQDEVFWVVFFGVFEAHFGNFEFTDGILGESDVAPQDGTFFVVHQRHV